MTTIVWFRQDLRIADNTALRDAASRGNIIPVYIFDDQTPGARPMGGASRWWLHHSLKALEKAIGGLVVARGSPVSILASIARKAGATSVVWNRCYEPWAITRDTDLKQKLSDAGLHAQSFSASLLHEPWEVETGTGGPFKVYSPFWRACLKRDVDKPLPAPKAQIANLDGMGIPLQDLELLPAKPNWAAGWENQWSPGEQGAKVRVDEFLKTGLAGYGELRNRPDLPNVSRLSPHLHFGEISPRTIWWQTLARRDAQAASKQLRSDADKFLSEIGWREFAYHLLYHFPTIGEKSWKPAFEAYPWQVDPVGLRAWQRGRTGYPMVDAGMRELWATGYMHNRVRMIVASFLVKHLRIHWREGEAWFWDTLLDADQANNAASWQWVTGSGADAAPYFRIFNPIEQGRKFDPEGAYVRRWCPELSNLPDVWLHAPFEAPAEILGTAGVVLGKTYPHPIVDHRTAREAALRGYELVKNVGQAEI